MIGILASVFEIIVKAFMILLMGLMALVMIVVSIGIPLGTVYALYLLCSGQLVIHMPS